jgi:hypothetical protein
MTHTLKTWPEYYKSIESGRKTFELRKNDRLFTEGDTVILQEFDPEEEKYTGKEMTFTLSYLLSDAYQFGLRKGFCILGLREKESYA